MWWKLHAMSNKPKKAIYCTLTLSFWGSAKWIYPVNPLSDKVPWCTLAITIILFCVMADSFICQGPSKSLFIMENVSAMHSWSSTVLIGLTDAHSSLLILHCSTLMPIVAFLGLRRPQHIKNNTLWLKAAIQNVKIKSAMCHGAWHFFRLF